MASEQRDGGPAFPQVRTVPRHTSGLLYDEYNANADVVTSTPGMSLRDWFAGEALKGLLHDRELHDIPACASEKAYTFADAMLEAREK